MVSRLPPTIISEKASQGRIHKCFYQLAPPAGSLQKTELVTTSHQRFICEIIHTLLQDMYFGKLLYKKKHQLTPFKEQADVF